MSIRTILAARGMLILAKHIGPDIADRFGSLFGVEATPPVTPTDDALTARISGTQYVDGLSTIAAIRLDNGSIIGVEEISTPLTEMSPDLNTLDFMRVLMARIAMDPNYLIEQAALETVYKTVIASVLIDDPAYTTDYSKLLDLHARVDSLTPGTPESDEALVEVDLHLRSIAVRIQNDPDYAEVMQELMNAQETLISKVLEDPAYEGLAEQLQSVDPLDFLRLWEEQAAELPDQAANLQELSSGFIELPDQAASGFIEGHEDLVAAVLASNPGTAPSPEYLVPGLTDIDIDINGDLPDVDLPLV